MVEYGCVWVCVGVSLCSYGWDCVCLSYLGDPSSTNQAVTASKMHCGNKIVLEACKWCTRYDWMWISTDIYLSITMCALLWCSYWACAEHSIYWYRMVNILFRSRSPALGTLCCSGFFIQDGDLQQLSTDWHHEYMYIVLFRSLPIFTHLNVTFLAVADTL